MTHKSLIWILALLLTVSPVFGALADNTHNYFKLEEVASPYTNEVNAGRNAVGYNTPNRITGIIDYGQSLNSGGSEYIDVDDHHTDSYSINFWVYANSSHNTYMSDCGSGGTCNSWSYIDSYFFMTGGTQISWQHSHSGGSSHTDLSCAGSLKIGAWHMITGTMNNTDKAMRLYVNGTQCTSGTLAGSVNNRVYGLWVGRLSSSYYSSTVDELGVWNRTLTPGEITSLFASGSPGVAQQYPFTVPANASTDVEFTAIDQWNSSTILNFAVNITWSNGTQESHGTASGSITLTGVGNPGSLKATYWNTTDYYELTLQNETITENASNSIQAEIYQAVACFNATAKVSGAYITPDQFTIDGNTHTSCFNISEGDYNVMAELSGWYDKNQTFNITALTTSTSTVENMTHANLTIYAVDGTTNESLSGYTLNITSLNHSGWPGETPGSVTNYSFYLINGTYTVEIDMPGYALTGAEVNISVEGATNHTFTLYKTNSVQIYIWDEITGNPITENITIRWTSNATTWENTTDTGDLFISNITADVYELLFYGSNYSTRTYTITVGNRSSQVLNVYMIASTYSTIFTVKDIDTGAILDGVAITMYKQINSTWTTVESKFTDISGKVQFYYDPIAHYRFYLSKADYEDYIFYLNPILFSEYDVFMTKASVLNYSVDFDDISIIYSPTSFFNEQNTTFNFLISSPDGLLTEYGITLTYPGGSDSDAGNNAIGEQLTADVNLTGADTFDYVVLQFNYTTSLSGVRTYTVNLPIVSNYTGGTWLTNKDRTYGLGIFERLLIATIIIIFIVGIATMVGQPLPGAAIGLFVYGFLVFIGFIPIWAILPSMLVGVLFLIWKSGGY